MKLFIRKATVFILPFFIIALLIWFSDPYKILYKYDNYTTRNFSINRHFVTTQYFLDNHQKNNYNAYIFGNSRTLAFRTEDWKIFLEGITPYHFDATGESINGIKNKIKLIDENNARLDQAIILLDRLIFLEPDNYDNHLFRQHYMATGESKYKFYWYFFKSLFNYRFVYFYGDYLTDGLLSRILNKIPKDFEYTTPANDIIMTGWEKQISHDENEFFKEYEEYLFEQPQEEVILENVITEKHIKDFRYIKTIFDRAGTKYKIIIGPDYRFMRFHPDDLHLLQQIFGKENIYDYSGKTEISENKRNFYDGSHYRPYVGKGILKEIYNSNR